MCESAPSLTLTPVTFVAFATGYPWMFLEGLGSLEMVLVFGVLVLVCLGILKAAASLSRHMIGSRRAGKHGDLI